MEDELEPRGQIAFDLGGKKGLWWVFCDGETKKNIILQWDIQSS